MRTYQPGESVVALMFGGKEGVRVVVKDLGRTVVITTKEEWARARRCGEEPNAIGFPRQDIRPDATRTNSVCNDVEPPDFAGGNKNE